LCGQFSGAEEFFVRGASDAGFAFNWQLEAIAVFRDGADCVAAYDLSQADDGVGEVGFADVDRWPEGLGQLLLADEVARPADEAEERVKGLGLEGDWSAGPLQEAIRGVELKISKPVGSLDRALIFL